LPIDPIFHRVFERIYGKPAWRVSPGWGSFLTFEFGDPHLEIREPIAARGSASKKVTEALARRRVFIHGDWHLWINCCDWKVWSRRKLIGRSISKSTIQRAADILDGQKLVQFSIRQRQTRCVFEFDLGGRLETEPYDHESEQWLLYYSPEHKVLTLRADSVYSYGPSNRPVADEWKPVEVP
jgi:hypothetical protein